MAIKCKTTRFFSLTKYVRLYNKISINFWLSFREGTFLYLDPAREDRVITLVPCFPFM